MSIVQKKIILTTSIIIGIFLTFTIILLVLKIFFDMKMSSNIKKEVIVEIGKQQNIKIEDFFNKFNYNLKIDIEIIDSSKRKINSFNNINEIGQYEVKIKINRKTYNSILKIVDTEAPVAETKDLNYKSGNLKADDFIISCNDNSLKKCIINFKEDYKFDNTNQKLIIVVSDESNNSREYEVSLNKNKEYVKVTFNCNCNEPYDPLIIKKGQKIKDIKNPSTEGKYFKYWSLNGVSFNFNSTINKDITLNAEYSDAKWTNLWIVLSEINHKGNVSKISSSEFNKFKTTGKYFEEFIERNVPSLDIVNTFVYDKVIVKKLSSDSTFGYYVSQEDIESHLEKFNYNDYDSVIVIGNMLPYKEQLTYAGLTWGDYRYSFIPDHNHLAGTKNSHEVFIHEWLHQVESWYDNLGYNVPNLHDNATYGFYSENKNGWKDWYAGILTNKLKGGPSKGINPKWWKETPTGD